MSDQYQSIRVSRRGVAVTDAVVTVNGISIPHCCGNLYSGKRPEAVPAGGTLTLKVVVGDTTFEAPGEVTPTPIITAPAAGSTFASTEAINLAWSSPKDPDQFEVCLNCWNNSIDAASYQLPGSQRDFKIEGGSLTDYGTGSIVTIYAYKKNFLTWTNSEAVFSNVLFYASSGEVIRIKYR
jgi:hypothetical protein